MKSLAKFTCFLTFIALIFSGCSKQGPTGPAGSTGPAGPAGPAGPTGTANVIYSAWAYATDNRDTVIDESKLNIVTLAAASLTAGDLDSADIQLFFNFGGGDFPLPYTSDAGAITNTISFIPEVGQIIITRYTDDNSASIELPLSLQYRFVITPGGVSVPNREKASKSLSIGGQMN